MDIHSHFQNGSKYPWTYIPILEMGVHIQWTYIPIPWPYNVILPNYPDCLVVVYLFIKKESTTTSDFITLTERNR